MILRQIFLPGRKIVLIVVWLGELNGEVWRIKLQRADSESRTELEIAKQFAKNCQITRQKVGKTIREITNGFNKPNNGIYGS